MPSFHRKNKEENVETRLIHSFERIFRPGSSAVRDLILGIGDDTAILSFNRWEVLLLTTDTLVENVHFRSDDRPGLIGRKALNCSISDIAAMGGRPTFAVVSIALPEPVEERWIESLMKGVKHAADAFSVTITGGDTVRAESLVINVTLLGRALKKSVTRRDGARDGDQIYVSGQLGGSLESGRHLKFTPRVREAIYLVEHFKPSAMMDLSDGLYPDLSRLLQRSRAGALVETGRLPLHKGVGAGDALTDGEDFELLFTLPPEKSRSFERTTHPFAFTRIGEINDSGELVFIDREGREVRPSGKGFDHFRKS